MVWRQRSECSEELAQSRGGGAFVGVPGGGRNGP